MIQKKNALPVLLIVDDDTDLCYLLKSRYQKAFNVLIANDLLHAYQLVKANELNLVLLDYNLPDGTGTSLLAVIRKTNPGLPVIMMSGNDTVDVQREALQLNAYDFLPKPLNWSVLDSEVDHFASNPEW
ncbi:MAG: response regulator [Bacteroidota bacterium]